MVVTEHVNDKEALGSFIYHLCNGKDTYRLRRRATRRREWPLPWFPDHSCPQQCLAWSWRPMHGQRAQISESSDRSGTDS